MSPWDGSCQKLRKCVYICQSYAEKKLWLCFFRTRCIVNYYYYYYYYYSVAVGL